MNGNRDREESESRDGGFRFEVSGLYAYWSQLEDKRKRRGKGYPLAVVLTLVVLAKLCGEDEVRGIAEWARLRGEWLVGALGLRHPRLPHWTTYSRVLSTAVDVEAFDQAVSRFFQQQATAEEAIALDGKTLRGPIAANQAGQHLLSAYGVESGVVLQQADVEAKTNEITTAPTVLQALPLQGRVVTGDAMFTQRALSEHIVTAGGEYVWIVKDNQPALQKAIELSPQQASPHRLLRLVRQHWRIENHLHYVRDVTLAEDACRLRSRPAQRALAIVNNLVVGVCHLAGFPSLPSARRFFAARLDLALAVLL